MIDLDRASLDHVLPPEPEPAGWHDVLSRSRVHVARRRRRIVVLAAVALLLVATATAFGVRALILDKGFIGVPPEGVMPSAPEHGELVLKFRGRPTVLGGAGYRVWVYADGRLIWDREGSLPMGASQLRTGFLEQRLTPEGAERLRSEALSTGLFGHDLSLVSDASLGAWGDITVRQDGQLVQLDWITPESVAESEQFDPSFDRSRYRDATPKQNSALERLTARLTNPASWLPASAWQDREIRAYVPSRMAVCAGPLGFDAPGSLLPDRAKELLPNADMHDGCYVVTLAKARAIADALEDAGLERVGPGEWQAYRIDKRRDTNVIFFETILPHGESMCTTCG